MRKLREKKAFGMSTKIFDWNPAHESNFVESSFDGYNSVEENLDERENGGGDSTQKGLGNNDEGVQLEVKESIIQPV